MFATSYLNPCPERGKLAPPLSFFEKQRREEPAGAHLDKLGIQERG